MSDIKFSCKCGQPIACDVTAAGATVTCPGCGKSVTVPKPGPALERRDVFLSYRRAGGENLTRLVLDSLVRRGYTVFMDVESLKQGKFNEAIVGHIDMAMDVVVVCSRGALDRCVNDGDWVRKEIYESLLRDKNVIRLTDRGFQMPKLPPDIARLAECPEFPLTNGYSDAAIGEMAEKFFQSEPDPELRQIDEASEEARALQWAHIRSLAATGVAAIVLLVALFTIPEAWWNKELNLRWHRLAGFSKDQVITGIVCTLVILVGAKLCRAGNRAGPWLVLIASFAMAVISAMLSYYIIKTKIPVYQLKHISLTTTYLQCAVNTIPFLVLAFLYRKGK